MKGFEELHKALQQMIDGKNTMHVPARENEDADLILAQGIKEHRDIQNAVCCFVREEFGNMNFETDEEVIEYLQ